MFSDKGILPLLSWSDSSCGGVATSAAAATTMNITDGLTSYVSNDSHNNQPNGYLNGDASSQYFNGDSAKFPKRPSTSERSPTLDTGQSITSIAIIGMSCRFPGDCTNPEKLWEMISEGRSGWSSIPSDRFNQEAFYHPSSEMTGTVRVLVHS